MRSFIVAIGIVAVLGLSTPAQAQVRGMDLHQTNAATLNNSGPGVLMKTIFNPKYFQMGHSIEFTAGTGFGSLAMYTNTLQWSLSNKFSARADVSVAYSPFSNGSNSSYNDPFSNGASVFLRNAELNYSPRNNVNLHLSYSRSPYGYYAQPFGAYRYRRY